MSAFHKIIANVRSALERRPHLQKHADDAVHESVPRAPAARRAELASEFALELERVNGRFIGVLSLAEARDQVVATARELEAKSVALGESVALQRKFFDRYLKNIDNGWEREPKVEVAVRAADDTVKRVARDTRWPLPGTKWTRFYLDASSLTLAAAAPGKPASASYAAIGEGLSFSTAPLERALEFAGPIKA